MLRFFCLWVLLSFEIDLVGIFSKKIRIIMEHSLDILGDVRAGMLFLMIGASLSGAPRMPAHL